jgi:hypothetical protein
MFAFASIPAALGDTFTFNKTNDVWDDPNNWDPAGGPPGTGDTAIIPSDKTCRVEDANQAAEIIQVSGTLGIVGRTLTLGKVSNDTTSTVNGAVYFEESGGRDATLAVIRFVTIDGSGTLTAKADDSREGVVDNASVTAGLILGPEMTLTGTFLIDTSLELERDGEDYAVVVVNDADDTVTLGKLLAIDEVDISGQGQFQISAGSLIIKSVTFDDPTPKWVLSGTGEIELVDVGNPGWSPFTQLHVPIQMSGGTLTVDDDLGTTASCMFSGGTITVKNGNVAEFRRP